MKTFIVLGLGVIVGWNLFLIQRDNKMYESYGVQTMEVRN
jgi:hypothetical protein